MKKFGLLVGNGFTLDFLGTQNTNLHSSYPLKKFKSEIINYDHFIKHLPFIQNELFGKEFDDFEVIAEYASKYSIDSFEFGYLRQFLALSYSLFQLEADQLDFSGWKWTKWLSDNKDDLVCSISFNYDLTLERALKCNGISYNRVGTIEPQKGIPILKPHGSIDFDLSNTAISMPIMSRFYNLTFNNDNQIMQIVPSLEWFLPRTQADIIPPSIKNYQKELEWVKSVTRKYSSMASKLDALVIVGCSYWDVDRPEIDVFLEKLPKYATVFIGDPRPSEKLIDKIKELKLTCKLFDSNNVPW